MTTTDVHLDPDVDYEPDSTDGAVGAPPILGAKSFGTARVLAGNWQRWAVSSDAFAGDLAGDLVAQLAVAATLAELPAAVIGEWVDALDEPIEILTAHGRLDAAAWLATIEGLPGEHRAALVVKAGEFAVFAALDPAATVGAPATEGPWIYPSLIAWMDGYFFPVFQRSASEAKQPWCPEWWYHLEAVQRLNALWRAWETMRKAPGEEWSTWWTSHLDAHLAALTNTERGPFSQCGNGHREYEQQLPHEPPPPRWPLPTLEANQP